MIVVVLDVSSSGSPFERSEKASRPRQREACGRGRPVEKDQISRQRPPGSAAGRPDGVRRSRAAGPAQGGEEGADILQSAGEPDDRSQHYAGDDHEAIIATHGTYGRPPDSAGVSDGDDVLPTGDEVKRLSACESTAPYSGCHQHRERGRPEDAGRGRSRQGTITIASRVRARIRACINASATRMTQSARRRDERRQGGRGSRDRGSDRGPNAPQASLGWSTLQPAINAPSNGQPLGYRPQRPR